MNRTKIIIAIGLFAVAGLIFWFTSGEDVGAPDTEASKTAWRCADCEHRIELTAAEYVTALSKVENGVPLICKSCGKREVYQITRCPLCFTEYFGREVPGHNGTCPICNPPEDDPMPVEPAPERKERVIQQL